MFYLWAFLHFYFHLYLLMSLIVECGQVPSPSCHLLLFEPTHPTQYKAPVDWSYCANVRVHIKTKSFHNVLTSFHLPFNIQSAIFAQQWLYLIFVKKGIWLRLFWRCYVWAIMKANNEVVMEMEVFTWSWQTGVNILTGALVYFN